MMNKSYEMQNYATLTNQTNQTKKNRGELARRKNL